MASTMYRPTGKQCSLMLHGKGDAGIAEIMNAEKIRCKPIFIEESSRSVQLIPLILEFLRGMEIVERRVSLAY